MTLEEAIKYVGEVRHMSLDWDDNHYVALGIAIEALNEKLLLEDDGK